MFAELLKLAEQALQCRPTCEIKAFTGGFVQGRAMVLGVIDIKSWGQVLTSYLFSQLYLGLATRNLGGSLKLRLISPISEDQEK